MKKVKQKAIAIIVASTLLITGAVYMVEAAPTQTLGAS